MEWNVFQVATPCTKIIRIQVSRVDPIYCDMFGPAERVRYMRYIQKRCPALVYSVSWWYAFEWKSTSCLSSLLLSSQWAPLGNSPLCSQCGRIWSKSFSSNGYVLGRGSIIWWLLLLLGWCRSCVSCMSCVSCFQLLCYCSSDFEQLRWRWGMGWVEIEKCVASISWPWELTLLSIPSTAAPAFP